MTPEAFYAQELRHPFAWEDGRDCVRTADRWCQANGHPSFYGLSRLKYGSLEDAENLMRDHLMPIWVNRAMIAAGYHSTASPNVGDVGIVTAGASLACAVRGSLGWLFRTEAGLSCYAPTARVLRAWSVA